MSVLMVTGVDLEEKTTSLLQYTIRRAVEEPDKDFLWFAPEQMTMDIERRLIRLHPRHALSNIRVYGLHRFARQRIMSRVQGQPQILDEIDKILLLENIVLEKQEELGLLKHKLLRNIGYVNEVKSVISEFQQYCVQPEELEQLQQRLTGQPVLRDKLADLTVLYRAFLEILGDKKLTGESLLERAAAHVGDEWRNTVLIFDGFTGLTPQQYVFVEALLAAVDSAVFGIAVPEHGYDSLFDMGEELRRRLGEMADHLHIPIENLTLPRENCLAAPILHLRQQLFRSRQAFSDEQRSVSIRISDRPEHEVADLFRQIRQDITEGGLRFRDIGIIVTDPTVYHPLLQEEKLRYDFPLFMDENRSLWRNPLLAALFGCLDMVVEDYRYEAVFRWIESGFAAIDRQKAEELERFVLSAGIRGRRKWEKAAGSEGAFAGMISELMQPIFDFHLAFSGGNRRVATKCQAIRKLLADLQADSRMEEAIREMSDRGYADRAAEYRRISEKLDYVLTRLELALGEQMKSRAEFSQLLQAALSEVKVGMVPSTLDAIPVGDLQRSRFGRLKKLYILGCKEDAFDGGFQGSDLINGTEREYLAGLDGGTKQLRLAPTARELLSINRYYTFMALTKPTEELVLSHSRTDRQGRAQSLAYVLHQVEKLFPHCRHQVVSEASGQDSAPRRLPAGLRLSEGLGERLFQCRSVLSPSSLERFASCPYAYFLSDGLGLREDEEFEVHANDIGTLLHSGLEQVMKWMEEQPSVSAISEEELSTRIEAVISETKEVLPVFDDSSRNRFLTERLRTMLLDNLLQLRRQIEHSAFQPRFFEKEWRLNWGTGERPCILRGKIDRVDLLEVNDEVYARVIDYKTGRTVFSVQDVMNGVQLQLSLYLAALRQTEGWKAGGMYYYRVDDPIENEDGRQTIEALYRMDGPTNADRLVLQASDSEIGLACLQEKKSCSSEIIPVKLKADGQPDSYSKVLTDEQFDSLFQKLRVKVGEYQDRILAGDISVRPYVSGSDRSACDYCRYGSICRLPLRDVNRQSSEKVSFAAFRDWLDAAESKTEGDDSDELDR